MRIVADPVDGIRARFTLRGEWAVSDDAMLIATLKNGRADYEHG